MIPIHGLVTLAEAKDACGKRAQDKKVDPKLEVHIAEQSDRIERLVGRRLIFRSDVLVEGEAYTWETADPLDLTAALPDQPDTPFTVGIAWGTVADARGTLVVEGTLDDEPVSERIEVSAEFERFVGRQLFDEVDSLEAENALGDGEFTVNLHSPYEEFHDTEMSTLLYVVNRPIAVLLAVAEGGIATSYVDMEQDVTYVFDRDSGKVQKVGFSGAGSSGVTIGPNFPDDEFFRFPRGRKNQTPAFISGARAVRLRYTGGVLGDANRTHVPSDLRALCKRMVNKAYRGAEYQDDELTSQSGSGGTRSKKSAAEWDAEVESVVSKHRSFSFTSRVQLV